MPLFFSQYSHTRQRAYAKYPYNVARRFSSFILFLRIVVKQVTHSLVLVSFPTQSPDSPLSIHLFSLSLVLALGRSRIPLSSSPSFIIIMGALYVLLSINI